MDAGGVSVHWRLLILYTLVSVTGVLTAKAFYCRDPDTGDLHPVNTTWNSTSFCGKYSCKLRRKSLGNQSQSAAQFVNKSEKYQKPATVQENDIRRNFSGPIEVKVEKSVNPEKINLTQLNNSDFNKEHLNSAKNIELLATTSDGDRYLTEEEIKALSLLLQTMKKSDLEAILEVYNLAQEIYKEIDQENNEKMKNNKRYESKEEEKYHEHADKKKDKKSYWYEPLTADVMKLKAAEVIQTPTQPIPESNTAIQKPTPSKVESNAMPKSFYDGLKMLKEAKTKQKQKEFVPKGGMSDKSYFIGPLTSSDFRKLPYYHPLSNFQKVSSYVRPVGANPLPVPIPNLALIPNAANGELPDFSTQKIYQQPNIYAQPFFQIQPYLPLPIETQQQLNLHEYAHQLHDQKPLLSLSHRQDTLYPENYQQHNKFKTKAKEQSLKLIPWSSMLEKRRKHVNEEKGPVYHPEKIYDLKNSFQEFKLQQQSLSLPVALLQPFNLSYMSSLTEDNRWDFLHPNEIRQRGFNPYSKNIYDSEAGSKLTVNTKSNEDVNNVEKEQVKNTAQDKMPDWQTAPLALTVLEEIKANIAKPNFSPFPFRKKIKLEKVGKVTKHNANKRIKRNSEGKERDEKKEEENEEEYEAYLERLTCQTDTEPGFFRMGNATEPFPACCPQKILS